MSANDANLPLESASSGMFS
jgi:hypothetical protein